MSILEARNITMRFGGLVAVNNFSLSMAQNQLYAIIGPNGAGKTTVFNILTGIYQPTEGEILINGKLMKGCKPHDFTEAGLARTFQNIRLFTKASVLDNVKMAQAFRNNYSFIRMITRSGPYIQTENKITEEALYLLEMFGLSGKKDTIAQNLPYGEQRKLEIVRALATNPSIVLLDEPAAGMNPNEIDEIIHLILRIKDELGKSVLLIEHHMKLVMSIAEYVKVLDFGEIISEGPPSLVQNDPKVIKAYLGGNIDAA